MGARVRAAGAAPWIVIAISMFASPASAATMLERILTDIVSLRQHDLMTLALLVGVLVFAATTSIVLVRTRMVQATRLTVAQTEIAALRDEADRALALLLAEPQLVVVWRGGRTDPAILGDPAAITGTAQPLRVLAFGSWLDAARAYAIEHAVDALRRRGEPFSLVLNTKSGRHVEAEGRPIGGAAVLRLRDVTGAKLEHAVLAERHRRLERELEALRLLLESAPAPIWLRNADGSLSFANRAYASAVEAADPSDAVERGVELLDSAAREEAARVRAEGGIFAKRVPAVVAGARRLLDVYEVGGERGAAGIGIDASDAERLRSELARAIAAHRRTLDQLATAVVIFGSDERLVFHNEAYRKLFGLDAAFLEERPTDSAILDRLRASRQLPEQADFRAWKAQLHEAYRAPEPREHWWHLPGGRTLRVVTTANPEGGVAYLFDDITERIELESRFNAMIRTQGETLDALTEAVAVFGSDGRLKLFNRAFVDLWGLSARTLAEQPHIEAIGDWCRPYLGGSAEPWKAIQLAVTGLGRRQPVERRIERADARVLDCTAVPLPDGGTLVTFRDVSDSVRVERALIERNEALEAADSLKNAFVGHVSYELRSPLTTIIGFAQLLDDPLIGPLNEKQREYVRHITDSSASLLAIINDILDLATIDAGAMQLELGEVDVRAAVEAAAEGVRTRLVERSIRLDLKVPANIGSFVADEKRVRQVLFNLLSNAVGFSPYGEKVTVSAERTRDAIVFRIADRGPGIPHDLQERVFGRFESHPLGSQHRGAGLGLAIVRSLMVLHGGSITIDSQPGMGTVAVCMFPIHAAVGSQAAE
ncbi:MAG TPA: PAS-domain containing protein [Xanthobacteraceae bacterium]